MNRINKRTLIVAASLIVAVLTIHSCGSQKKVTALEQGAVSASLSLSKDNDSYVPELNLEEKQRDIIQVQDFNGRDVLIMKAVKDEETGEMVANDVIDAAVVTARFRNVAERHGKVDLAFQITVPEAMQDSKWQIRFYPDMFVLGDSIRLDPVIITGNAYRKAQLKGYQQYERFLNRIVSDTTKYVNVNQLEFFLRRNIPQIYAFKTDSTEVSDELFESCFGVSEQQAVNHYTNKFAKNLNERRKSKMGAMYRRYVKAPIVTEGIRLDTVMVDINGDFIYNYVQTINTRPKLRKVDIVLSGAIFEQDKQIYTVPRSEPLTFYISSISAFADNTERYLTKVIERRAEANTECKIDFEVGKYAVKPEIHDNIFEIRRIKDNLASLIENDVFDLDSIVVSATASPEGTYAANKSLAQKRSEAVSDYFSKYIKEYRDSLKHSEGISINMDETYAGGRKRLPNIKFTPRCIPENWDDLKVYVATDSAMTDGQKARFDELFAEANPDTRENLMRKEVWYSHLKDDVYPRLRTVKFNFYLHRKGMVKDTVHTTVIDSAYMTGVQALKDMDYDMALSYLREYQDFNTAVAYVGLDRNLNALEILKQLKKTPDVDYLMAVIYSRMGDEKAAVEHYVSACRENRSYVHRGNLDPEISSLIKAYGLNKLFEEEFDDEIY